LSVSTVQMHRAAQYMKPITASLMAQAADGLVAAVQAFPQDARNAAAGKGLLVSPSVHAALVQANAAVAGAIHPGSPSKYGPAVPAEGREAQAAATAAKAYLDVLTQRLDPHAAEQAVLGPARERDSARDNRSTK
jgi:hypothetical protein